SAAAGPGRLRRDPGSGWRQREPGPAGHVRDPLGAQRPLRGRGADLAAVHDVHGRRAHRRHGPELPIPPPHGGGDHRLRLPDLGSSRRDRHPGRGRRGTADRDPGGGATAHDPRQRHDVRGHRRQRLAELSRRLVLVLIFGVALGLLPLYGWTAPEHMLLPTLALAIAPIGVLARYVRSSMLENLRQEYVVTARAKGGRESAVLVGHVLRNSLMPLVTVVGPMFASLATGTIFVEQIFGIPGLGHYFTQAAVSRDMPLLMGTTLFFAALLMVMNLL